MKTLAYALFFILVLFQAAGCDNTDSRLVGKWVGKTGSIEFFINKTGIINPPGGQLDLPANVQFRWDVLDKERVLMSFTTGGGKNVIGKFAGKEALIVEDDRFVKQR